MKEEEEEKEGASAGREDVKDVVKKSSVLLVIWSPMTGSPVEEVFMFLRWFSRT